MHRPLFLLALLWAAPLQAPAAQHAMPAIGTACLPPVMSPWRFSPATVAGRRDFVATISVECRSDVSYSISLVSSGACTMRHDGLSIAYDVFLDPGHRIPVLACGPGFGLGDDPISGIGTRVFTVYGEALVNDSSLSSGNYEDTVNVLLHYGSSNAS